MKKSVFVLVLLITMLIGGTQITYGQTVNITPAIATVCAGNSITLTEVATGGPHTRVWTDNWGNNFGGAVSITVTPLVNTTYTCTSTFIGPIVVAATRLVTVNTAPTATISGATSFCQGSSTTLTSSTTGGVTTYQWRLNGGNILLATNPTHVVTSAGSYDLVVNNGACGATSNVIVMTQNPLPIVITTPLPNDTVTICSGSSTVLSTNFNALYTYQWQSSPDKVVWTDILGATSNSYTANTTGWKRVNVTLNTCTLSSNP